MHLKLKVVKNLIMVMRNTIPKQSQLMSVQPFDAVTASFLSKYSYKLEESEAAVIPGKGNKFSRRICEALEFCASPRRSIETVDLKLWPYRVRRGFGK